MTTRMTSANTAAPRGGSARTIARVQEFRGLKKFGSAESHGFCRKSVKKPVENWFKPTDFAGFHRFSAKTAGFLNHDASCRGVHFVQARSSSWSPGCLSAGDHFDCFFKRCSISSSAVLSFRLIGRNSAVLHSFYKHAPSDSSILTSATLVGILII
jgi:hypothetical protein